MMKDAELPAAGAVPAALPADESQRLAALHGYRILDTLPEEMFDDMARLAARICDTPIALISLVDSERQWFKARVGLEVEATHRDLAFCAHAILEPDEVMIVPDATVDHRFARNDLVTADPQIRFYAGAPIVAPGGAALGTVCAIDRRARTLTSSQVDSLRALARQTSRLLEYRSLSNARHASLAEEVSRSRQRLIQIASASGLATDLLSFFDRDYICRYANDTYLEYWATQRPLVEGHHLAALVGDEVFAQQYRPVLDRALAGERVQYEGALDSPGHGRRLATVTCLPVRDDDGAVTGAVLRVSDVHTLKQTQRELQQMVERLDVRNAALQRFIYMMSHDIREPVNTICNFSGLLEQRYSGALDAEARRYLGFVSRGGVRIRTLLDDLLSFVGLDDKILAAGEVDLELVVDEVIAELASPIAEAAARVRRSALPRVRADARLMRVLFRNLISNAIKFRHPGVAPQVSIESADARSAEGLEWAVAVRDNGIGVAPEHLGVLFSAFKRLRARRQYDGTGLGLAICKRIVEMHGGRIEASSELDRGSQFTVSLPRSLLWPPPGAAR